MAKLVIINKDKSIINVKSFNCRIDKLCSVMTTFNDILYHTGTNALPVDGDIIYKINDSMQYELFNNNTAAIRTAIVQSATNIKYIQTDNNGVCKIITCN